MRRFLLGTLKITIICVTYYFTCLRIETWVLRCNLGHTGPWKERAYPGGEVAVKPLIGRNYNCPLV